MRPMQILRMKQAGGTSAPAYNTLLNFNGADASTTFTDDTGNHTWSAGGNAQIDTAQSKFGGASGLFDGTGDYISAPSHADWAPGTGDFGWACWVRQTGTITQWRELFMANVSNGLNIMLFDGKLAYGAEGVANDYTAASAITQDAWVHLEVSRASGTVYGFVGGASVFSGPSSRNFVQGVMSIGAKTSGISAYNGWIDSMAYIKGSPFHTSAFTPPVAPYSV